MTIAPPTGAVTAEIESAAARPTVAFVASTTTAPSIVVAVERYSHVTIAALAGTTDNKPKLIAATVASATRLKVVFVDICFLSISRAREFPPAGLGKECLPICHERVFIRGCAHLVHRNLRCN
jgi:hypothetical protein